MVYYLHVGESKETVTIQTLMDSSLVEVLDTDFRCRYCYHKAANGGIQPTEEEVKAGETEGGEKYVPDAKIEYTKHDRTAIRFSVIPNTLVIQIVRTGIKTIVVDGEQEVQRIKYNRPVDFLAMT